VGAVKSTALIHPARSFQGEATLPGDKSISHRALIFASLGSGPTEIRNIGRGDDIEATIRCLRQLGVEIETSEDGATVRPPAKLRDPDGVLDCGNSGTTMRLLAGIVAGAGLLATLDGDESLRRRPMGRVLAPLRRMGARCEGQAQAQGEERAPLSFHRGGRLEGRAHRLEVASAQVKSALLLAGLFAEGETTVEEPHPSRDHTERMIAAFCGASATPRASSNQGLRSPKRDGAGRLPLTLPPILRIPGDASSAAFLATAAIVVPGGEVTLRGVGANPTRLGWVRALQRMGAAVEVLPEGMEAGEPVATIRAAHRDGALQGIEIFPEEVPGLIDEVPVLAVAATQAQGETRIVGAKELRYKESDRLASMALWLSRMGAWIEEEEDGLSIHGPIKLAGAQVGASSDHRVAMSLAVAALVADGPTSIEGGGWASVSFPAFFPLLQRLAQGRGNERGRMW
jgi:3-phosphoshikimate 1-carboxyvinyltransferase